MKKITRPLCLVALLLFALSPSTSVYPHLTTSELSSQNYEYTSEECKNIYRLIVVVTAITLCLSYFLVKKIISSARPSNLPILPTTDNSSKK